LDPYEIANNSFSVLFDSLAPARLALRANRVTLPPRLPAFSVVSFDSLCSLLRSCLRQSNSLWSVVVNFAGFGFKCCENHFNPGTDFAPGKPTVHSHPLPNEMIQ